MITIKKKRDDTQVLVVTTHKMAEQIFTLFCTQHTELCTQQAQHYSTPCGFSLIKSPSQKSLYAGYENFLWLRSDKNLDTLNKICNHIKRL